MSKNGIESGERKIMAVENFSNHKNVRVVRRFIVLGSYFWRFVKGFAVIVRPVTDLLSKDTRFVWTKVQDEAFRRLKYDFVSQPILSMYDLKAYTEVHPTTVNKGLPLH